MLHALLGDAPGLEPLKQMLRRRGNPFFLEETVRTLVETKALEGERGAYRLVRPVQSLQIPATVQAILAARIDRLPAEGKQLLQTASVIGKDVPFAILTAIAQLPEEALRGALGRLQEAEFLYETSLFPDLEYTFKHALTHEVTYSSLLQDRRRTLHNRVVEAIERLYPDRLAENVERLGHHAFRGEVWEKALPYLRQAGTRATTRLAMQEATAYFEQALVVTERLPATRKVFEQSIDIRAALRTPLFALNDVDRLHEHLRAGAELARGKQLYADAECLACHGEHGHGDGPSAPTLKDSRELPIAATDLTKPERFKNGAKPEDVYRTLVTGLAGTPMPSYADSIETDQAWDLVFYVLSLSNNDRRSAEAVP